MSASNAVGKKPFHEVVAENLIEQLKAGTAPWQRPWEPGNPSTMLPTNPITGKRYKGINAIHLMGQGRSDQRWMTYKQAESVGAQVRKGERGCGIQYWKFFDESTKLDSSGKPVLNAKGEVVKVQVKLERPRVFFATVFNAEQIDGMPPVAERKKHEWSPVERAERILSASGASISYGAGDAAFYHPVTDTIRLPEKNQFPVASNFYATALHELGHWTGHESRLARDLANPFGSEGYAKEELRAEIASMIIGDELGIGHDPAKHAAYVGSWIKKLKDDPLEIFRAAADAEKIHNFVLAFEQKQEQEIDPEQLLTVNAQTASTEQSMSPTNELGQGTAPPISQEEAEKRLAAARDHEERVRADERSSADEVRKAREETKLAEIQALLNSQDMRARVQKEQDALARKPTADIANENTFIEVPFKEKNEAKALGAKWDRSGSWYVPAGMDMAKFAKWAQKRPGDLAKPAASLNAADKPVARKYLAVPFSDKDKARAAGAMWDKAAKSWYVGPEGDLPALEKWMPAKVALQQDPAKNPREEFADALRDMGCIVTGDHPIMDGKKHRISVEGEKITEKQGSGVYFAHLDGHPAGYICNHKTGMDTKWKAMGYTLDPEAKAQLLAIAADKLEARRVDQEQAHEATVKRLEEKLKTLQPVKSPTPYMLAKGIEANASLLTDKGGSTTYVPGIDASGKMWTMQYITEDGTKRYAKESRKEGCFFVPGGLDALSKAPAIVVGEGVATADTVAKIVGFPTVAAFDSGNLLAVVTSLHAKYPEKPVIVIGDDDKAQETREINPGNPGKEKALEAAAAVGGTAIFPIFAPGEQESNMRGFTDFNDLGRKSVLGMQAVERQVGSVLSNVVQQARAATAELFRQQGKSQRQGLSVR